MAGPSSFNNKLLFAMGKAPGINLRDRVPSALDMMGGEDVEDIGTVGLAPETVAQQITQSNAAVPESPASQAIPPRGVSSFDVEGMLKPTPEQVAQLKALEAQRMQSRSEQKKSIADLEEMLKVAALPDNKIDLSPLLSLADAWGGSKLSQGYQKPETAEEKAARISGVQAKIASLKGDVAKEDADALEKAISNQGNTRLTETLLRNKRGAAGLELKARTGVFQAFSQDKDAAEARKSLGGVKELEGLVSAGNPVSDAAIATAAAKAAGAYPLSNRDVETFGGSRSLADILARFEERLTSGKLDEKDRGYFKEYLKYKKLQLQGLLTSRINDFSDRIGPLAFGVDPETTRQILTISAYTDVPEEKTGNKSGSPSEAKKPSLEEIAKKFRK